MILSLTVTDLMHFLSSYGYLAVFLFIAIESLGVPFPGETMLLTAAIYAGTTHNLNIAFIIIAASIGAIIGDNTGYLIGRSGGFYLLDHFGKYVGLDKRKLRLGQYLFLKYGAEVVFFGRFISILRTWAAFLAGANKMHWKRFLLFNALGGIIWSTVYGLGGFLLGKEITKVSEPIRILLIILTFISLIILALYLNRNLERLEREAEKNIP